MKDVKHRHACTKLAFYLSRMREVYTEHLVEHFGFRRYVDVAGFIQDGYHHRNSWQYFEVKHDLSFDLGEELRKASDVMHVHRTTRRDCDATYVLVLPEGPETLEWLEQNAWYIFGSEITFVVGFNPSNPYVRLEDGDAVGVFGAGMSFLMRTDAMEWNEQYLRYVYRKKTHEECKDAADNLRQRVLERDPDRFGRQFHSPLRG